MPRDVIFGCCHCNRKSPIPCWAMALDKSHFVFEIVASKRVHANHASQTKPCSPVRRQGLALFRALGLFRPVFVQGPNSFSTHSSGQLNIDQWSTKSRGGSVSWVQRRQITLRQGKAAIRHVLPKSTIARSAWDVLVNMRPSEAGVVQAMPPIYRPYFSDY